MAEPFLQTGDVFTIAGVYKPRTFWQALWHQWLLRRPRELQRFTAGGQVVG